MFRRSELGSETKEGEGEDCKRKRAKTPNQNGREMQYIRLIRGPLNKHFFFLPCCRRTTNDHCFTNSNHNNINLQFASIAQNPHSWHTIRFVSFFIHSCIYIGYVSHVPSSVIAQSSSIKHSVGRVFFQSAKVSECEGKGENGRKKGKGKGKGEKSFTPFRFLSGFSPFRSLGGYRAQNSDCTPPSTNLVKTELLCR